MKITVYFNLSCWNTILTSATFSFLVWMSTVFYATGVNVISIHFANVVRSTASERPSALVVRVESPHPPLPCRNAFTLVFAGWGYLRTTFSLVSWQKGPIDCKQSHSTAHLLRGFVEGHWRIDQLQPVLHLQHQLLPVQGHLFSTFSDSISIIMPSLQQHFGFLLDLQGTLVCLL